MMEQEDLEIKDLNRREFLKLSGILGIGMALSSTIPGVAEAVRFNKKLYKVSRTRLTMGTFVSITTIHSSRDQSEDAIGMAFEEIERLVGIMSRFDSKTAISQLNKEGILKDLSPEVSYIISRSLYFNKITNGCFDITVKPVIDLFKQNFVEGHSSTPSEKELSKVMALVGSSKIRFSGKSISFQVPGMGITLDGIAKGYIVDKASDVLTRMGIKNHLINAGGDIRTQGEKSRGKPWTIAIQDPQKRRHYPDIIQMRDGAVATSGNYEVYFDKEKMFHHIVNPKTGLSPHMSTSVSVIAPNAMDADALATGIFVMNPVKGTHLINSMRGYESLIITSGGEISRSSGWRRYSKT
jgi:thiamine biosynthesis lipoprotein